MSLPLDDVTAQALQLSAEDRALLIDRPVGTVLPAPSHLHPAWEAEIARRVADLDAGRTSSIPAEHVFADVRGLIANVDAATP